MTLPLQDERRQPQSREEAQEHDVSYSPAPSGEGQNFTTRSLAIGLLVGLIICFSNTYFGLQTGWVSGMTMPASLISFAFFKVFAQHLSYPFTPVENVLVQTVASAVGTMPLGSGFVGVIPAMEYLLKPSEGGPLKLGLGRLVIFSLGLCFFGVVFGVPLRKQVIIREKLKFPSGTATALMIDVLHGSEKSADAGVGNRVSDEMVRGSTERPRDSGESDLQDTQVLLMVDPDAAEGRSARQGEKWKSKIRLLVIAFIISGVFTLTAYFLPFARHLPVLGIYLAREWLWTLNPSPAYVGQGIIMGPTTTLHMLLGAIVGWGILSPLAKRKGWAPGPVKDWEHGSKGWIVWVSLAIMLADSVINLGWLVARPLVRRSGRWQDGLTLNWSGAQGMKRWLSGGRPARGGYTALTSTSTGEESTALAAHTSRERSPPTTKEADLPDEVAPPEQLVSNRTVTLGLISSLLFCILCIHLTFGSMIPLYATLLAILMALLLSIMGVRALGETDLNPVSGISKLTQLFFALVLPASNPNSVLINLVAGAVSEAGALQAGDMLQDLKTGHLLRASPKAQFYGQLIGSFVGAVASAIIYKLYTSVYPVPGDLFQVPTGYVWVFTARLVTGKGLPARAWEWAVGAGVLFAGLTMVRIGGAAGRWTRFVPGGIAVAVGMYNVPSFTLARAFGGLMSWYWTSYRKQDENRLIILASGLILGEGVVSIVNLILASCGVPHL